MEPDLPVDAWRICEGTHLPGGAIVLHVRREVVGRTVEVLTDELGAAPATYRANDMVSVARLADD